MEETEGRPRIEEEGSFGECLAQFLALGRATLDVASRARTLVLWSLAFCPLSAIIACFLPTDSILGRVLLGASAYLILLAIPPAQPSGGNNGEERAKLLRCCLSSLRVATHTARNLAAVGQTRFAHGFVALVTCVSILDSSKAAGAAAVLAGAYVLWSILLAVGTEMADSAGMQECTDQYLSLAKQVLIDAPPPPPAATALAPAPPPQPADNREKQGGKRGPARSQTPPPSPPAAAAPLASPEAPQQEAGTGTAGTGEGAPAQTPAKRRRARKKVRVDPSQDDIETAERRLCEAFPMAKTAYELYSSPGWEPWVDDQGIQMSRKEIEGAYTRAIMVETEMAASFSNFVEFIRDPDSVRKYDKLLEEVTVLEQVTPVSKIVLTSTGSPVWGIAKRDFVAQITSLVHPNRRLLMQVGQSVESSKGRLRDGYVRGTIHTMMWRAESIETPPGAAPRTRVTSVVCVDPNGSLPKSIVEAASKKQLQKMVTIRGMVEGKQLAQKEAILPPESLVVFSDPDDGCSDSCTDSDSESVQVGEDEKEEGETGGREDGSPPVAAEPVPVAASQPRAGLEPQPPQPPRREGPKGKKGEADSGKSKGGRSAQKGPAPPAVRRSAPIRPRKEEEGDEEPSSWLPGSDFIDGLFR